MTPVCKACRGVRDPWFECPDCHDRQPAEACAECEGRGSIAAICPACLGWGHGCRACDSDGAVHQPCPACRLTPGKAPVTP